MMIHFMFEKKNGANSGKCNIRIERLNAHIFNIHALGSGRDYKNKCMHANIFSKKQWNLFKFVEKIKKFARNRDTVWQNDFLSLPIHYQHAGNKAANLCGTFCYEFSSKSPEYG